MPGFNQALADPTALIMQMRDHARRAAMQPVFPSEEIGSGAPALAHNAQYAVPGPYTTPLNPQQTGLFHQWLMANHVLFDPRQKNPDYDMQGYYKDIASQGKNETGIDKSDNRLHFPDTYKTPRNTGFSSESKYSKVNPMVWRGDDLIDLGTGQLVRKGSYDPGMVGK